MSRPRSAQPDPRATLRSGLPDDRYLTPDDIAEMFEVPKETVYQSRRKRTPPGFRIGKHIRYDPADVRAYVTERRRQDAEAA